MRIDNIVGKLSKIAIAALVSSALMVGVSQAHTNVSVGIGIGGGGGYGNGYASPYGPNVVYVPGHWAYGVWVPAQYVEYAPGPAPQPGYIWIQGGFDGGHRWHGGHWTHHGYHHHR